MSSADYRNTEVVFLSKLYSLLNVFRSLRCHDKGSHPFFLIVSVGQKLVGSHTGRPIGCIVSSGDKWVGVTLRVRGLIDSCGRSPVKPAASSSSVNQTGVVQTNLSAVDGQVFEIDKSLQTKTTLVGAGDQISKIFYFCRVWPTLVPWLTVFLGQTLVDGSTLILTRYRSDSI